MKTPLVNSSAIASAVQSCEITNTRMWEAVSEKYPGVELFGIDADPRSFEVTGDGLFDGRSNILISVPKKTRSGRKTNFSLTIAARVFGELSPDGNIMVSEFKVPTERLS